MRPYPLLFRLALCLAATGCHGDEPKVDKDGCWLDGEEANMATLEASCESSLHCHPELDSSMTVESCVSDALEYLDYRRESECFDGCAVQTCLDRLAEYRETCSPDVELSYCWEETFYDGLEKECVQRPW